MTAAADAAPPFRISAVPEAVGLARRHVAEQARAASFDDDEVADLALAVGEACSNAVRYGRAGDSEPEVWVTCTLKQPGLLQVDIRNQGNGFHPDLDHLAKLPDPAAFATQGRGYALMMALVTDVEVISQDGNTIVRLTKASSHGCP